MSKFKDVFSSVFLKEESETKSKKNTSLKIFYNIDILINNPNKNLPEQPVQQEPAQQPVQQPVQQTQQAPQVASQLPTESVKTNKKIKTFLEDEFNLKSKEQSENDDYEYKKEGVLTVPKEEFENIQTLEDVLDYLSDAKDEEGKQILNEAAIELVLSMVGVTQTPLEDIVKKEDKVLIDVLYGNKKEDSIGFKVLKRDGVNSLSIVMKKNNEVLDGKFDLKNFNSQILLFRNEATSSKKV